MSAGAWAKAVATVAARPSLWPTAVRQWRRMVPRQWWRRRPFLPVPPAQYRRLRMVTQYGDERHPPEPRDVLHYMVWCRQWSNGAR